MFETLALYQNDPQWKDVKLGFDQQETIGTWGCLLTSMTMVANGFGFNETPATVNDKMKSAGGFQGALIIPAVLPSVCPGVIYKGYQPCENSPAPLAQIDAALAAGMPVIVQVDWSPKAGLQTHWVVLYGKEDGRYLMKDPYRYSGDAPDKKLYLTDRYKHMGTDAASAITGVIWFQGTAQPGSGGQPPPERPKVAVPADSFVAYSTADGLAFRSDPNVNAYLIKRLPLMDPVTALEGAATGKPKVGTMNEWLHIQDQAGDQGYVAAWYLTLNEKELEEQEEAPKTGDKEFIVRPTTTGLAFRSEPSILPRTMIKRLPGNATLAVLEPEEEARKKLGVRGAWLKVRDITGQEGYVAAWYITAADQPAVGVRTAEKSGRPTEDAALIVLTTTEGVAMRNQPQVADNTLIKRMPDASVLLVLDENAEAKVGVAGQWLKVRDIESDEGYVAAWYLAKRV
ncbi:MAG: hypothetical protein JW862_05735 [Anaerolineales bacterium]|nr:hypothetical protein [Anaerolineales bacterium]